MGRGEGDQGVIGWVLGGDGEEGGGVIVGEEGVGGVK